MDQRHKGLKTGSLSAGILLAAGMLFAAGCGRFGPPKPPEVLAPKKVSDIKVTTAADKVSLSWREPDRDVRGKELKTMDGYSIVKADAKDVPQKDLLDDYLTEIGFVPDRNIEERETQRKEARARGEIGHRLKVPDEKKNFSFEDAQVKNDDSYYYRIIPLNQNGVKGEPSDIIKVFFKGEKSDIFVVKDEAALDRMVELNEQEMEEDSVASTPGGGLFQMRD